MWISSKLSAEAADTGVHTGKSTLNAKGSVEAVSTGVDRGVKLYTSYGYNFSLPAGTDMLLAECGGETVGLGVPAGSEDIKTGEIKITAASGAFIHLLQDGSVIINGLKINRNGVIE